MSKRDDLRDSGLRPVLVLLLVVGVALCLLGVLGYVRALVAGQDPVASQQQSSTDVSSGAGTSASGTSGTSTQTASSQSDQSATVLVMDTSGSMDETAGSGSSRTKMDMAKEASTALVNQLSGMNVLADGAYTYAVGVVTFDSTADIVFYPTASNASGELSAISSISANGGTEILEGLQKGIDSLASSTGERTMILLSDGKDSTSDETILAKAREASGEGIRIFTVGFGRQGDLDEDLLRSIASVGGGTYQYADPTSSMSLIGRFLGDQARSTGEVLAEDEGTLNQGETSEAKSFDVGEEMGDLSAVLAWPGSKLESVLTDPLGRVVDQGYSGLTVDDSQIPSIVVIENPLPGTWSVSVHATETSQTDEPYYSLVSFRQTGPLRNEGLEPWQVVSAVALPVGTLLVVGSAVLLHGMRRKAA